MTNVSQIQRMKCFEYYARTSNLVLKALRNLYATIHGPYLIRSLCKKGNSGCPVKHWLEKVKNGEKSTENKSQMRQERWERKRKDGVTWLWCVKNRLVVRQREKSRMTLCFLIWGSWVNEMKSCRKSRSWRQKVRKDVEFNVAYV